MTLKRNKEFYFLNYSLSIGDFISSDAGVSSTRIGHYTLGTGILCFLL